VESAPQPGPSGGTQAACGARFHLTMATASSPCEATRAILGHLRSLGVCITLIYCHEGTHVSALVLV
jgi:hypothetical protein